MGINNILKEEKIFNSAQKIKYLYQPAKGDSSHLVVVFSAFNPKGAPPAYNYIRTIQHLDVNKLFILDDQGERGSYYLGKNRVFHVEASVVSLITFIANENSIPHNNIICCGSSKGGYASLYFSIKYGFGSAIVGAPQTKLGNYLNFAKEYPTLEFIAGDSSVESIQFLDSLLYDVVTNAKKVPDIYIHVGSGDHHYKGHVLPFEEHLNNYSFNCFLDIKDYSDHGDVQFYQKFLVETIIQKVPQLKNALSITSLDVEQKHNYFTVTTQSNKKSQYAWYVFKNGERIETKWYIPENSYEFEAKEQGVYYFLAFAKDENGNIVTEKTKEFKV